MAETGLFSLTGRVAVVIGGGGVLGGAMATGLAQAGAGIAVLGRNKVNLDTREQAIGAEGGSALGVVCDATGKSGLEEALAAVMERFGRVDILINAAGVNSGTPFFEITEEEFHRIIDIDLTSVFLAC